MNARVVARALGGCAASRAAFSNAHALGTCRRVVPIKLSGSWARRMGAVAVEGRRGSVAWKDGLTAQR